MRRNLRPARGFTIVELMIVVGIIGILASIAIPGYQRITARGYRTENNTVMSKFRLYFKNVHDNQGTFSTLQTLPATGVSAVNPSTAIAVGQPSSWAPNASGWSDVPFPPEGAIRMRYWYTMGVDESTDGTNKVHQVTLQACGSFPGFGQDIADFCKSGLAGNYLYTETLYGNGTSTILENPTF